jgi:hypothetical protein
MGLAYRALGSEDGMQGATLQGKSPSQKSVLKWEDNAKIDLKEYYIF